jgi:hypothetical protein
MPNGFPNKPKILRGAFVEYGLSLPPLAVVFQFNPLQLTRNRSLNFSAPSSGKSGAGRDGLRKLHRMEPEDRDDLLAIQEKQIVDVNEETISFDIRLDATDKLNDGDTITQQFGIAPQLATLELMVHPKTEGLLGEVLSLISSSGFSFTRGKNPPLMLCILGPTRVLPVNITSLNITETEFSTTLYPIRATAAVSLTVIEGRSIPYLYSKTVKEAMSALNLANITDVANVVIPK